MERQVSLRQTASAQLKKISKFLWNSPTFTTWGKFIVAGTELLFVTPLVLARFSTEEIAVWYLFASIIALGNLADLGFSPTFMRLTAFVMGGANKLDDFRDTNRNRGTGIPNWYIMERLYSNTGLVYLLSSFIAFLGLSIGGTYALKKPILAMQNNQEAWLAWSVICVATLFTFSGKKYSSLLMGLNYVPLVNRWNILFGGLGVITSCAVLLLNGGLLELVLAQQTWLLAKAFRDRLLLMTVEKKRFKRYKPFGFDREIFSATWSPVWRTAIGIAGSTGVVQATGVIYAQVGDVADLGTYLFSLNLMNMISVFSQAPFYSKIPLFSRLRAEGKLDELADSAGRSTRYALLTFVAGSFFVGIAAAWILVLINANTSFVSPALWSLMMLVWFLERHHAMHAQIYSTTNHIPFYIPILISGVVNLALSILLVRQIGVWAFPVAHLTSNAMINNWWNVKISMESVNRKFSKFYYNYGLLPSLLLLLSIYLINSSPWQH